MKAAILREINAPLQFENVTIDNPGPHEVLVRVAAVGLCHSDLHGLDGTIPMPLPTLLGHEAAGVVEKVGTEVRGVKPGDHVIACLSFYCGHCEQCLGGHSHRCYTPEAERRADEPPRLRIGSEPVSQFCRMGAFAEQMLVHESGCIPIRHDMPFDRACLISCGVTTGFGAATRSARVQPGETVAVIGCGGVGLAAINGAAVAGAARIIAVDVMEEKCQLTQTLGATDFIAAGAAEARERVMELTRGAGVDHAIEAIGRQDTMELAFRILKKGGLATIVGVAAPTTQISLPALSFLQERRIQGSTMGGVRNQIDIPRYVELYLQGRLKLDQLISRRRPFAEINEGFADFKKGTLARTVLTME